MKTAWTVNWLFRWWLPTGVDLAVVVEAGHPIRAFLGDEHHHVILRMVPTWRPWRYRALLDDSVRALRGEEARVRRRMDAAHDAFCRGLDGGEGKGRR